MHFQTEQSMQGGQVLLGIHDSYQCHLEWWRSPGGQIGENFFFFFFFLELKHLASANFY